MAGPTVKAPDIRREVNKFLDNIYPADIDGYLYSPTLNRKENDWQSKFFAWPSEREGFIQHVLNNTGKAEVYIGPALYKSNKHTAVKSNVKGSKVVWVEFDGVAPQYGEDIPVPHMLLKSSDHENHFHVYWQLDEFCSDPEILENTNRALTHTLGADSSGWDSTQVLRLPLTFNHKRGQLTSELQVNQSHPAPYSLEVFAGLKVPTGDTSHETFDYTTVPGSVTNLALEKMLGKNGMELFEQATLDVGKRSSGMMALAYYMAEHRNPRLTDAEMFAVLKEADDKWGKFKDRRDRNRRLLDIVIKARQKYPWVGASLGNEYGTIKTTAQLMKSMEPIDWVVEGVLEEAGLMFLAGPPGCGKTQVSLNFALHMACSKPFLGWNFGEPRKMLFVSMEMGERPLQHFLGKMLNQFTAEELELIEENLSYNTIGYGIPLDDQRAQEEIERWMQEGNYKGVFFDSLGQSTTDDLTQEKTIKSAFTFVNRLKAEYNAFMWFIHHTRKAQAENKRPNKLSDLYGSQYIAAHASSVVGLYPLGGEIEVKALKIRMDKEFDTFRIARNSDSLGFHIPGVKGLIEAATAAEDGEEPDDTDGQNVPGI